MIKGKKCPECGLELAVSEFYMDETQADNLSINCKKCINKYFQQISKKK